MLYVLFNVYIIITELNIRQSYLLLEAHVTKAEIRRCYLISNHINEEKNHYNPCNSCW